MIVCLLITPFAAAIEQRDHPQWRRQPLILGEPAGKVYAVSIQAARLGVQAGMPLRQAQLLCPEGYFAPPTPGKYSQVAGHSHNLLATFTHLLQSDHTPSRFVCYLDLEKLSSAGSIEMAKQMGRTVRRETRLAPAIGLASNQFTAHLAASTVRPHHALRIAPGHEARFLAPFPLHTLPLEEEMALHLQRLGIHTLGELAALPSAAILNQLGQQGATWHQLAQGHDPRPVLPPPPSMQEEATFGFDEPVSDERVVRRVLQKLSDELATRLQAGGWWGRELGLAVHFEREPLWTTRQRLRQPLAAGERLAQRLEQLWAQSPRGQEVAGLVVTVADLVPASGQQLSLFAPTTGQEKRLRRTLASLLARYGPECFYQVSLSAPAALLPEERLSWQEVEAEGREE